MELAFRLSPGPCSEYRQLQIGSGNISLGHKATSSALQPLHCCAIQMHEYYYYYFRNTLTYLLTHLLQQEDKHHIKYGKGLTDEISIRIRVQKLQARERD